MYLFIPQSPSYAVRFLLLLDFPGVLALGPYCRTLPIDNVNWNANYDRERKHHPSSVCDAKPLVHGTGIEGAEASKDISREAVAASCRGRVFASVGRNHVVNGGEVYGL
jgi:hypothetical protein